MKKSIKLCPKCNKEPRKSYFFNGHLNCYARTCGRIKCSSISKRGFQKNHIINIGRICSVSTRNKIREANLGKKLSVITKQKISRNTATRKPEIRMKMRLAHLGKKLPPETISKIVESRKWYKHSNETKEKIGKKHLGKKRDSPSEETKKKLSQSMKSYWGPRIDKTHNKIYERIRHCLEMRIWRENVFKRDSYTCIWCGDNRGGNLEVDHIKPFILILRQNNIESLQEALECFELWNILNGRTLCKSCHKTTNTWGAKVR